jgi:hypothetical protein
VPDLPAGYQAQLPEVRPVGLRSRRVSAGTEIWRVDATDPAGWTWEGFPDPRYRFDPASEAFRTRYASTELVGAFRERYRATGLVIPSTTPPTTWSGSSPLGIYAYSTCARSGTLMRSTSMTRSAPASTPTCGPPAIGLPMPPGGGGPTSMPSSTGPAPPPRRLPTSRSSQTTGSPSSRGDTRTGPTSSPNSCCGTALHLAGTSEARSSRPVDGPALITRGRAGLSVTGRLPGQPQGWYQGHRRRAAIAVETGRVHGGGSSGLPIVGVLGRISHKDEILVRSPWYLTAVPKASWPRHRAAAIEGLSRVVIWRGSQIRVIFRVAGGPPRRKWAWSTPASRHSAAPPATGGGLWFGRCRRCGSGRWSQPSWRAGSVHHERAFLIGRCRR